jgi:hypothetical protein
MFGPSPDAAAGILSGSDVPGAVRSPAAAAHRPPSPIRGNLPVRVLRASEGSATFSSQVAILMREVPRPMAIHLTPTELAREAGMERREVIWKCTQLGVPIYQGRIDKTLFLASVSEQAAAPPTPQAATA